MVSVLFYTLILSFASGIFLRSFFVVSFPVVIWLLCMSAGLFLWSYRKRTAPIVLVVVQFAVVLGGVTIGIARINLAEYLLPSSLLVSEGSSMQTYAGKIVREPESTRTAKNAVVQIGGELVLVKTDRHADIRYGDTVAITGPLQLPAPFVTDQGRVFNYPGYLRSQGIAYVMPFGKVVIVDDTTGNPVLRFLLALKERFIQSLTRTLPEPEVGLGKGLLLGVNHSLSDSLETIFRQAGIIHIVVLSGYNIMLVVQFVLLILGSFVSLRARAVIGVMAIILFALMVGLGASVVRASVMAALALVALLLGRRYAVTRALFFAGAVMLLVNPYLLVYDVGFQLSFMATLGLLLLAPQLTGLVAWMPEKYGLREFLLATIATQIAVLPILLYAMGEVSLVSLVVNLLVLPLVAIAMLLTFITGIVGLIIPSLAIVPGLVAYAVLAYIIGIATQFAALPFAVVTLPFFPWYGVVVLYALVGGWLYLRMVKQIIPVVVPLGQPLMFNDWTVVEEVDVPNKEKGLANVASPLPVSAVSSSETTTPIFFR